MKFWKESTADYVQNFCIKLISLDLLFGPHLELLMLCNPQAAWGALVSQVQEEAFELRT